MPPLRFLSSGARWQVVVGKIKHPCGGVGLLKAATDSRDLSDFVRGGTLDDGCMVEIVSEHVTDSGEKYLYITATYTVTGSDVLGNVAGFVKPAYVVV